MARHGCVWRRRREAWSEYDGSRRRERRQWGGCQRGAECMGGSRRESGAARAERVVCVAAGAIYQRARGTITDCKGTKKLQPCTVYVQCDQGQVSSRRGAHPPFAVTVRIRRTARYPCRAPADSASPSSAFQLSVYEVLPIDNGSVNGNEINAQSMARHILATRETMLMCHILSTPSNRPTHIHPPHGSLPLRSQLRRGRWSPPCVSA